MIKNERQYRITKTQVDKFASALSALHLNTSGDALMKQIEANALTSQLEELRQQMREFDELQSGKRTAKAIGSFDELPQVLIEARIAAGLSQKDLADRLGLKEQQIQRYEATEYKSASFARLCEVVKILDINFR